MAEQAPELDRGQPPTDPTGAVHVLNPSIDAFISYASQDAAVADAIVHSLEGHGFRCWIAPRDVTPGEFYADAIVRALNVARTLVLVLTENAATSQHVLREVERTTAKRHSIISFRVSCVSLPPALEYFLSASHWLDASASGVESALPKLVNAVRSAVASPPVAIPAHASDTASQVGVPSPAPSVGTRASQRLRRPVVAIITAVAIIAACLVVGRFWIAKHVRTERLVGAAAPVAAPVAPVISDKSIAVLPFTDMSEKKDQEYFADGMAEEILDLLAKIPGLTVIGRTSSFQFKGKNQDLRTIGTQLNAAYILEGSIRKSADQVRITAQLIDTRTGTHEWSETYDRHIGDVLKLQDAIAAAVVRELQLTVASGNLISHATVKDADSYDLILRGRHAADRGDQGGYDEAVMLFQQAIGRDPSSADAAANLALTYVGQVSVGSLKPAAGFEQARRAATNALKLDPQNVLANAVMAKIYVLYDWDWAGAERLIKQTASLAPGNVDVILSEVALSSALGRWDDALRQVKVALAQDPINPFAVLTVAGIQDARGHLAEAEAAARRALDIRPDYDYGHFNLGLILLERGDRGAALREMQQETNDLGRQEGLAVVYHALERTADSNASLARMLKEQADTNALGIAEVYAFRGQSNEAMYWLERAYAQKDTYLYSIKSDALLENLRGDPRYKAFLRKMNLPD